MKFVFKEEVVITENDSNIVDDNVYKEDRYDYINPDEILFVRAIDPETGSVLNFIPNNFELSTLENTNIYSIADISKR